MKPADFTFRPLTRADFPLLVAWIARPHVAAWWGSKASLEEVESDYGAALEAEGTQAFIACFGEVPIGFIQVYRVMSDDPSWWPDETDPGARGIDQFLAEESQLGQGLGTRMITAFVDRLFADPAVTKVQVDPSPANARAIRAYEKAGFERVGEVQTPDGPALLMVIFRTAWAQRALGAQGSERP